MKPDKKIIQQLTDDYFNNHKNWFFENLEALEYKEQFILQEIDRTDSAIKDLEKHLQNPDLRSDDNISYLQGGYKYLEFLKKEYQKHLPPQQTETKTEQETPTFTNNFDKIKPTEIFKHFKAGLVEKGYLTEQELNEYLKAAFELKTIPETLFKIKDAPNKAAIEAVFYTYYKNVAGKIHGTQNQYAALLGDYFEGYKTTTVSSNFSKSVY